MRLGIRLQLLIALGALLLLAFVPLYVAMASLTRSAMVSVRESSVRSLGRAISGHVMAASRSRSVSTLQPLLDAQVGEGGVQAIAVYDEGGARLAEAGERDGIAQLPATVAFRTESVTSVDTPTGAALLVVVPQVAGSSDGAGVGAVATLLPTDTAAARAGPLVRLFGLYTGIVALALLVFAYISMTRLVVRPVVQLKERARRVADGARGIDPHLGGAAELVDLGSSLSMMTARLRADEEALRAKVDELEKAQEALRSAQESLVRTERLASVGRLAAGVAHEIGNPIAAILGFQELLLTSDFDPDERKDFLERMKKETERVHRVLRDLLDFAKPAGGHSDSLEPGAGDVRRAIEDALALVRPQKGFRGIELFHEVEDDLPRVTLGDERLVQLLLNLLLNASDAVPEEDPRIAVRAEREDGKVRIAVDDNGPGVSTEIRDRLFEPFVTTKEVGKGTGLGLAVCRGLVEAAGGSIEVEDAPGGGARFVLEIPEVGVVEEDS